MLFVLRLELFFYFRVFPHLHALPHLHPLPHEQSLHGHASSICDLIDCVCVVCVVVVFFRVAKTVVARLVFDDDDASEPSR